jgi:hypothetical protein
MPLINQEEKEKKNTIIILVVICLVIVLFIWKFFFSNKEIEVAPIVILKTAPKIDFDFLESPEFKYFDKYETIEPLEEDLVGRDNPFLSY